MPSRILNTNMGLGFQRHRKYDTDLDRLGRMKTAQSELRKTRQLNLRKELRNMTYSVKRFSKIQKEYGIIGDIGNGVKNAAGSALETTGRIAEGGVGKTAGFIGGIANMGTGAAIGNAILPGIGGIVGALAAPIVGSKLVSGAGKAVKNLGQDLQS